MRTVTHALRVLEYAEIRERLAKSCQTDLGASLARNLEPAFRRGIVELRLARTADAVTAMERHSPPGLAGLRDLRMPLTRAEKGGVLGGEELFRIGECLATSAALRSFLETRTEELPALSALAVSLHSAPALENRLQLDLEPGGELRDSASVALAALRRKRHGMASRITETIQKYTQGRFRELLSDPIYTLRDGRYVVPLKAENRGKIRGIVHDTSASGQTIFLEPEEVVQLGNSLRETESAIREEEFRILTELSEWVGKEAAPLRTAIEAGAEVDLHFACARYGFSLRGTLPVLADGEARISFEGGRHPLIDPNIVVPLTLSLAPGKSVLITGPNTGGKTVAIKCVGLFVAMAQSGMMIPALQAEFAPFSQIWADIGDEQSLEQSLSTFSGHIRNLAKALKELKSGALVLLDEIGAGTDPAEGAALASGILRQFHRGGAAILASTHYGELKAFAYNTDGFVNAAMEFDEKSLRPTYRLLLGAPGASQALRIAERYGIAPEIIDEARMELGTQAAELSAMLDQLAVAQKQARIAQGEADRRLNEAKRAERAADEKLREAEDIRKKAYGTANDVIEAALREIRLEAARLFDELKAKPDDGRTRETVRSGLKDLDAVGREFAKEFQTAPARGRSSTTVERIAKGDTVTVAGFGQKGTVLEDPKSGQVQVQLGMVKLVVPVDRVKKSTGVLADNRRTSEFRLQKAMTATAELDLRHLRVEEALSKLERYVDESLLAGTPSIRIVHGKGEGVLRKVTQDFLRKHQDVVEFRDGEPAEGGQGVTIVRFE